MGGQAHWKRLCDYLTEHPVVDEVLAKFQQEWKVKGGRLRFNELDGRVELMKCGEAGPEVVRQEVPPADAWANYRPGWDLILSLVSEPREASRCRRAVLWRCLVAWIPCSFRKKAGMARPTPRSLGQAVGM